VISFSVCTFASMNSYNRPPHFLVCFVSNAFLLTSRFHCAYVCQVSVNLTHTNLGKKDKKNQQKKKLFTQKTTVGPTETTHMFLIS
jgi:hypothetical protein